MQPIMTYEEFRDQWQKQHPASLPEKRDAALPYPLWLPVAVLVMFLSAVLLSAVHTIPTVYEAIPVTDVISEVVRRAAAHAAVFVIELSLFIAVYASASGKTTTYTAIEIVSFVGALAANLDSVLSTVSGDLGGVIVGVIVGSTPPLAAALSGAVYVRMHRANARAQQDAAAHYRDDLKQLDAVILTAYRKYEKDMSAKLSERTDKRTDTALLSGGNVRSDTDTDGHGRTSHAAFGHERTPDGLQKALTWFTDNPDKANMSLRDLEPLVGVGRDTLSRARRQWQAAQQPEVHSNGTGA